MRSDFYLNDGNASREKRLRANSARDREEEVPCGALRTIPDLDTVEGVLSYKSDFGFPSAGFGFDVNKWFNHGLRFRFKAGRVVAVETDGDQAALDLQWASETGDKDRLGEFVLGCNPLLKPVDGSTFQPYYGYGDGIVRLTLGENVESGGANISSVHRWLMLVDADVTANGYEIVKGGRLKPEFLD